MDTFANLFTDVMTYVREHGWVAEVFFIVLATGVVRFIVKLLFDRLARQLARTSNLYDDALLDAARRPLGFGIWFLGIALAAEVAGGENPAEIFDYIDPVRDVAVIWLLISVTISMLRRTRSEKRSISMTPADTAVWVCSTMCSMSSVAAAV